MARKPKALRDDFQPVKGLLLLPNLLMAVPELVAHVANKEPLVASRFLELGESSFLSPHLG